MKLAWLCVVLATGCVRVVGGDDSGGDDAPCTGDACGTGSGSGSGSGGGEPNGCELIEESGPAGHLIAYELGDPSEWILTRDDGDERTTLWEYSATGWHARPLGAMCLRGFLAVSPSGTAGVACLVPSGTTWDLKVFEIGAQVSSSTVFAGGEGDLSGFGSINALPLSFVYDSASRPSVLWQGATSFDNTSSFYIQGALSRRSGGTWTDTAVYEPFTLESTSRLVSFGGELLIAMQVPEQSIKIVHSSALSAMAEIDINAASFDVVADANGVHVAVADADTGKVRYFRRGDGSQLAEDVGDGSGVVSIVLDGQGTPLVGFQATDALQLAHRVGTAWTAGELADGGVGSRSKIRFDGAGHLHVAYQDDDLAQVRVLREVCP